DLRRRLRRAGGRGREPPPRPVRGGGPDTERRGLVEMSDTFVHVEDGAEGVKVIRLDRPPMNALSNDLAAQFGHALGALRDDASVRGLVVWGGPKVFCAGADVKDMHTALEEGRNPGPDVVASFRPTLDALATFPRPTFAAITGYALGGRLEVALACDFRIAADDAKLGFPEILLGIFPGAGGTQRLPRLGVPARAKWVIYSGRQFPAAETYPWGLVDMTCAADQVYDNTVKACARMAAGATAAMGLAKRAIDEGLDVPLAE